MRELRVQSVMAAMTGAKTRGLKKFSSLPTWAGMLAANKTRMRGARKRTWASGARLWVSRFGGKNLRKALESEDKGIEKKCGKLAKQVCEEREWTRAVGNRETAKFYEAGNFVETRKFIDFAAEHPRLAIGVQELVKCRMNAFWTGKRAAYAGLISSVYKKLCPSCGTNVDGETLKHLLLECDRWSEQREIMFKALPGWVLRAYNVMAINGKVEWVLGGGQNEKLRKAWLYGNELDGNEGARPAWLAVASFLQTIRAVRNSLLWRTSAPATKNRRPSGYGMS